MQKFLSLVFLIILVSCGYADKGIDQSVGVPGVELGNSALEQKAQQFINEFNENQETTINGEKPAFSEVVKVFTDEGGDWIVVKHLHRSGGSTEDFYISYNLATYTEGEIWNMWNIIQFEGFDNMYMVEPQEGGTFKSREDRYWSETQGEWISKTWIFENSGTSGKDLEKAGSKIEALEVEELKDNLISFGMSEDKVSKIAKLATSYKHIKNKRALTTSEKDAFTKELTGLSFVKASQILVNDGYDALIEKAAMVNEADPEAIKELLNQIL